MKKVFKEILEKIEEYDNIVILRHEVPDFDASGSQFGLKTWILDNYPEKKVYAFGQKHKFFSPNLYPYTDDNVNLSDVKYLCIIVDTANSPRVDGKDYISKADFVIKIDHHPECESFGNIQYVDDSAAAACEIIAYMLKGYKKHLSQEAATFLYSGLVGDSGRFQYSSTSSMTFEMAAYLLKSNVNISEVYDKLYLKSIEEIKVVKYLYDIFKITPKGVGYYHVSSADLAKLNIEREQIKAYVNLLSGYNEIKIWVQFSEDVTESEYKWRVSIRSRGVKINDVASHFNGGGHDNASGAKCRNIDETMKLIEELDNLL